MLFKLEVERQIIENLTVRLSASFVRNEFRINFTPFPGNKDFESVGNRSDSEETRGALAEAVYLWGEGWRTLAGFDFKDRWIRTSDDLIFIAPPPSISFFTARRQEYAGYLEQQGSRSSGRLLGTGGRSRRRQQRVRNRG